ncbi:MAG TPA: DUF998 domain-containing protein [Candidatus Thermoplasmatota archaeon]|nr:DUF998 domain-containing protein [Candidatus Thermoplasmatota archaeon]
MGRRTKVLSLLGLLGIAEFVLAAIALHAVSLPNEPSHMSEFAHSRFWLVWGLALYTLVLGCAALIVALKPWLGRNLWARLGFAMLALAGLAAFVLATFPVDKGRYESTLIGTIHNDATLTTFMMLSTAMVVLAPAFRATPAWRDFARLSLFIGIVVGILGVVYLFATEADLPLAAYAQRVLVAFIAAWFILIALRLRRSSDGPASSTSPMLEMAPAPASPAPVAAPDPAPPAPSPAAPARAARARPAARSPQRAASSSARQSRSRTARPS